MCFVDLHKVKQFIEVLLRYCPMAPKETLLSASESCQSHLDRVYQLGSRIHSHKDNIYEHGEEFLHSLDHVIYSCIPLDFTLSPLKVAEKKLGSEPGAMNCVICGMLVTLAQNYMEIHKMNAKEFFIRDFCGSMSKELVRTCEVTVEALAPVFTQEGNLGKDSDEICNTAGYCYGHNAKCYMHKDIDPNDIDPGVMDTEAETPVQSFLKRFKVDNHVGKVEAWDWLKDIIDKVFDRHMPLIDLDNDGFSDYPTFRGYNWRGKDCSDLNKNIYPGRKVWTGFADTDHNCNGISGRNPDTGNAWEDELCAGTQHYGVVVVGDSAGAHFSLPPEWLNVSMWNSSTFSNAYVGVSNELDWPMKSASTGYTYDYFVTSMYKNLVELNRCNKNDYQNLGVNGGSARNSDKNFAAIRRNPKTDHPVWIVFELIGNDVCGKDIKGMTTVDHFREKILQQWHFFDTVLPKGSHMLVLGVADGRILYESLHDATHPIGITYPHLYDFLNCLKITPCFGWMNSNSTIRDLTTQRANELNQVYLEIIAEYTFENFDIQYYDVPMPEMIRRAVEMGFEPKDAIEPSDGFHPNQLANKLLSEILTEYVKRDQPGWFPAPNPNNAKIDLLFGDAFPKFQPEHGHEIIVEL